MKFITKLFMTIIVILGAVIISPQKSEAQLYIDIVASPRKLPIAIMDMTGPYGTRIAEIVANDLRFSGLFSPIDKKAFIERSTQKFNKSNWAGTGAEAVVKGSVEVAEKVIVTILVYDVFEGQTILEKQYKATRELIRPLAHAIANDIYKKVTGKKGMFRSRLAYVSKSDDVYMLTLSDWDGKRARPIKSSKKSIMSPRWHWSGDSLIYSAEGRAQWDIYKFDFSTLKESKIIDFKGTNIAGGFFPNGDRFTFSSSMEGTSDIYIYYTSRKKLSRLSKGLGIEVSPVVSPDGNSIAYVSDRGGSPQIYTMDKFGYNKLRLTYNGRYNTSPSWSPTGDFIVYSGMESGKNQIFTIWPDGTGTRKLTQMGNNEEPSFSPDGRFIAFTSDRDGEKAIFIMRADGTEQRRVTPKGTKTFSPRWSPN